MIGDGLVWALGGALTKGFPMIMTLLTRLAPFIIQGIAAAFALLSNPIGWAVILAGVAAALCYYFRDDIARFWAQTVVPWWNGAWTAIKNYVFSINWGSVGMFIADALTFGLASKLNPGSWGSIIQGAASSFSAPGGRGGGGVAGHRALGGPVRGGSAYLVGERGAEVFVPHGPGTIIPNGRRIGGGGGVAATFNIYGATDPNAVALQVNAHLARLAQQQDAYLND